MSTSDDVRPSGSAEDDSNPVHSRTDWRTDDEVGQPSTAIVKAIAAALDRDPLDMPPLHDYVSTDSLDALLAPEPSRTSDRVRVSFEYAGVDVSVDSDGTVDVWARD